MRNSIGTLVQHAAHGDEVAWQDIVHSYTPLLSAVCRRYGLSEMDADDIASRVWLHLLTNITRLREPAALPGWLRTTTRRECVAMMRSRPLELRFIDEMGGNSASSDARLLNAEQWCALRKALDGLTERDRRLLGMLFSDPPTPYAEISLRLGIPIGTIGPTRQRILQRLRHAHVWRDYRSAG
jgi:RNA polymerase sigma factor (sigma-70 family)